MGWVSIIREWVNFSANICILLITIYTFYITFLSCKIKFLSINESHSNNNGNSFSVVIENKSFSTLVVTKVSLIVNNEYKVEIQKFDSPLILQPFSASKIESDNYSYISPDIEIIGSKVILVVEISRKTIYAGYQKISPRIIKEIKKSPCNVTKVKNTYNGKIVPQLAKYILMVWKDEYMDTIFIFETGAMTEAVLGYNGIPKEAMKHQDTIYEYLNKWLKPKGFSCSLEQVSKYITSNYI